MGMREKATATQVTLNFKLVPMCYISLTATDQTHDPQHSK